MSTGLLKSLLLLASVCVQVTVRFPLTSVTAPVETEAAVLSFNPAQFNAATPALTTGRPVLIVTLTLPSFFLLSEGFFGQSDLSNSSTKILPVPECAMSKLNCTLSLPTTLCLKPSTFIGLPELKMLFASLGLHIAPSATSIIFSRTQTSDTAIVSYL